MLIFKLNEKKLLKLSIHELFLEVDANNKHKVLTPQIFITQVKVTREVFKVLQIHQLKYCYLKYNMNVSKGVKTK